MSAVLAGGHWNSSRLGSWNWQKMAESVETRRVSVSTLVSGVSGTSETWSLLDSSNESSTSFASCPNEENRAQKASACQCSFLTGGARTLETPHGRSICCAVMMAASLNSGSPGSQMMPGQDRWVTQALQAARCCSWPNVCEDDLDISPECVDNGNGNQPLRTSRL